MLLLAPFLILSFFCSLFSLLFVYFLFFSYVIYRYNICIIILVGYVVSSHLTVNALSHGLPKEGSRECSRVLIQRRQFAHRAILPIPSNRNCSLRVSFSLLLCYSRMRGCSFSLLQTRINRSNTTVRKLLLSYLAGLAPFLSLCYVGCVWVCIKRYFSHKHPLFATVNSLIGQSRWWIFLPFQSAMDVNQFYTSQSKPLQ